MQKLKALVLDREGGVFKYKKMVDFCYKYSITLGHSTSYYPQGNGLAESSNKSLINIIKKLLEQIRNLGTVSWFMPYGLIG